MQKNINVIASSPNSPVRQLELFISLHTAAVLKQKGQRVPWQTENTASLTSVKHVDNVEPKVTLQPDNIRVSSVKDLGRENQSRNDIVIV
jgi:hypothetical protein